MKEFSRFYSSLGLLIILNAIIKPVWIFAIDRQVQNAVGILEYGHYFSLLNLSIVASFLLDCGLTPYFNRQLATGNESVTRRAGNFLFLKLILTGIYAAVVGLIAYMTGVQRWDVVVAIILVQVFTSLFLFFRAIITARQEFRIDAFLSVLDKALMILVCGSLLFFHVMFGPVTIQKFVWLQVGCTAAAMLIAAGIVLLKRTGFASAGLFSFRRTDLFKEIMPYAFIVLLMSVHYRLDGFLLERIHPDGARQAGIYAGAYRLLDATNMIAFLFTSFLLPFVARQHSENREIASVVLNIRHILLIFSIGIGLMGIFLAPDIQRVLYHHSGTEAIAVLQWCLPVLTGYSLVAIYGTVMTATGHIRQFCWISLAGVTLNIILNLLLIPSHGAKGSCVAALVSHSACGIATMIYVKEKLKVGIHGGSLLIYTFIGGAVAMLFYWGGNKAVDTGWLVIAAALFAVIIMILTKLFRPSAWLGLFTKQIPDIK